MASAHGILDDVSSGLHGVSFPSRSLPPGSELPCDDGEPMDTPRHRDQMNALIHSLESWSEHGPRLYVGGNMFVYFSERQVRGEHFRGPDVFVVLGAAPGERRSWVLWEELKLPDVVIELTSDSTRDVDHVVKKKIYAEDWKTAAYVIYDPHSHQIDAFRLDPSRRRYVRVPQDARGDVEVAPLGLKLGVRDVGLGPHCGPPSLRWLEKSGEPLPTPRDAHTREKARADDEKRRADDEKRRADDEKQRADGLRAKLRAAEARTRRPKKTRAPTRARKSR